MDQPDLMSFMNSNQVLWLDFIRFHMNKFIRKDTNPNPTHNSNIKLYTLFGQKYVDA